ncbi:hypothetical protein EMIHUDRAFT_421878 [Emiliania huxleyi CCMP1516]|uniref:RanBP2-type domain-containing protein n=2 Tax=Emiliania huxleyi TaxID=2903 RepID=A0A0D3IXN6_EMIH1|nr:hypothetical protein EMIHUDRAFT_421878 [Emiliania huxleyi CCMP1516]EOD16021.1 hypothetical protein EMIHUDRAFT_421878 [Emiliania huxleyi CCMP1516]|eukprot:XP_005768450.1 hypothetical protein EMIHUDRAFT_421878 [Emiliania huxleyi CCMP1516]
MAEHTPPEMQRTPLAGLVLSILSLGLGPPGPFLARALQPPSADAVEESCRSLRLAGALDAADALTPLGAHLARMPLDVRVGKMVLYGALLGCIDPVLTIAAALSTRRSPFLTPFEQRQAADAARKPFTGEHSDHLAYLRAYEGWRGARRAGGGGAGRRFCDEHFLSHVALEELHALREQLSGVLADLGFASSTREAMEGEGEGIASVHHASLVRAIVCAGLYPNVLRARMPDTRFVDTVGGAVEAEDERGIVKFYLAERRAGGRVFLQPGCSIYASPKLPSDWCVYSGKRLQAPRPGGAGVAAVAAAGDYTCERCGAKVFASKPACFRCGAPKPRGPAAAALAPAAKAVAPAGGDGRLIVRDVTCVSPYALLLFAGGSLVVNAEAGTVEVDGHITIAASGRVGALLKQLRAELLSLLAKKLEEPSLSLVGSPIYEAIVRLITSDGL